MFISFDSALNFLLGHSGYSEDKLLSPRSNESHSAYVGRIYKMAERIEDCLSTYPTEIAKYCRENPDKPQYTYQYLKELNYVELAAIRKSLGISYRRTNRGQKVTKVSATTGQREQGLSQISQKDTTRFVGQILLNNAVAELAEERDGELQMLSIDEIELMYGEDLPSISELEALGYIPEDVTSYKLRLKF